MAGRTTTCEKYLLFLQTTTFRLLAHLLNQIRICHSSGWRQRCVVKFSHKILRQKGHKKVKTCYDYYHLTTMYERENNTDLLAPIPFFFVFFLTRHQSKSHVVLLFEQIFKSPATWFVLCTVTYVVLSWLGSLFKRILWFSEKVQFVKKNFPSCIGAGQIA